MKRLGHSHVEGVIQIATGSCPSGQLDLPHGIRVVRDRSELRFSLGPSEEEAHEFEYHIAAAGTTFIREVDSFLTFSLWDADEAGHPKDYPASTALFDLSLISFPLTVRNFREGDRFRPLGMSGSQKLKSFFINHKVSRSNRRRCPLILSGGKIIWVAGYRIDDSAKVTRTTKKVLKAELSPV
jgi:tRNA(Ile)-lysidine synthase